MIDRFINSLDVIFLCLFFLFNVLIDRWFVGRPGAARSDSGSRSRSRSDSGSGSRLGVRLISLLMSD